jgi:hypothetical protein
MPTEYVLGLMAAACAALFTALKLSNDRTVKAIEGACSAKDAEIAWLRAQLEPWSAIARTMVVAVEKLTERKP